jgi:outer membrane protein OmpA-like peptidoglycan-associated protein
MMLRLCPILLLAACSAQPVLTSTLAASTPASYVGVAVPALADSAAVVTAGLQQAELERRLQATDVQFQISRQPEDTIRLRAAARDSFDSGSAQLKPAALSAYAELGEILKLYPSNVAHVLVSGAAAASDSADPALDLGARRGASILDYLARRGVPMTRLRAEVRGGPGAGEWIEIVLRPVVQGREAQAWLPQLPTP